MRWAIMAMVMAAVAPALPVAGLWDLRRRGRQKFRRFSEDLVTPQAFADPRLA
ncbi:MAG: hypothetical protein NT171_04930 [Planctomycetota bacterium]|nr:hypothetical protein [Planctomycetota bacterium]